ncbi:cell envelope-related function transcriptional attenuator common domain-containing protein [Leifsonia sp. 98AMF]|uniref:LCP family protein n=1 Tax=unclassified Leifsonia TaxID=2663824 RepID=UPI00087B4F0F|nr:MULTISPECIES: LCP family protein [unclassified Leifsonia]SDH58859.1 cell envelope-related function transcriptional attenuator common domain-containing protein [Leifsonia sp. 197AMF]SDI80361.1 cell envelope-related function transcriptional attenuator common domain-containing protein [Leifsonia sp. 466MF]SDK04843.1 cell envelope-related function transcriptional attenuator common domain-containing protein [Leifsonia sp. 157MF]SDN83810.1 cell envelope-related function transcriptional attenuator 
MRRPNFPASDPGADGSDQQLPPTQVFGRAPSADPRRPVRATRPASGVPTGSGGAASGGTAGGAPFDPFGMGGDAPGLGGDGAGRRGGNGRGNGGSGGGGRNGGGDNGDGTGGDDDGTPTPPPGGRRDKAPRKRRRTKRIIGWTAAALAVILVVVGGYAAYSYFRFVGGVKHVDVISKPANDVDGQDQNILLVGDDHRPDGASQAELDQLSTTDDGGGTNTDTMMILHIPANGKSATLISLPRDSWVEVPGHGMNKLNAAFSLGGGATDAASGAKLLIQTVQNLTGLSIDHYVRVSLLGFYTIAQALGPVQVCLNNAVDDPYSGADFPAGVSTLDAKQALSFVRQRHGLPRGDLDRVVRQQYFLSVEAHKFLSAGTLLNPGKLTKVLDAVSGSLETDPGLNFLQLAAQLQGLTGGKIQSATIPISGTPTITVDGDDISIVEVDTAAMPAFIQSLMGTPSAYEKATAAKPADTSVTVLNGGSQNGAATTASQTLAGAGFKTGTPGDADTRATTVIQYPSGQEAQAKAVAAYLPGASVQETSSVSTVTVVLGDDGIMPTAPAAGGGTAPAPAPTPAPTGPATNYSDTVCIN